MRCVPASELRGRLHCVFHGIASPSRCWTTNRAYVVPCMPADLYGICRPASRTPWRQYRSLPARRERAAHGSHLRSEGFIEIIRELCTIASPTVGRGPLTLPAVFAVPLGTSRTDVRYGVAAEKRDVLPEIGRVVTEEHSLNSRCG